MRAVRVVDSPRRVTRPSAFTSFFAKPFFIVVAACLCAADLSGQDLPVVTYTSAQGLTHDIVTRVVQDPRGFLWIGGVADLARFDGERFTNYGQADGLDVGTGVNQLTFGPDGNLWIATNGAGIFRFNVTTTDRASRFMQIRVGEGRPSNRVNTMFVAADGRLWAGTDAGLFVGSPQRGLQRLALPVPSPVVPGGSSAREGRLRSDSARDPAAQTHGRWPQLKFAAGLLRVTPHTVSFHLRHCYEKLEVHSKSEAVAKALRSRLI